MKLKWLFLLCWFSAQFAFADTVAPIRSMPPPHVVVGHNSSVYSVAFSPDGNYALSGSWDKTLKLWEVNSGAEIRSFAGHTDDVNSVAFSPDGRYAQYG
jgi:WD40 repeat protein